MAALNKVILLGNLGRDPEIKQTKAGDTWAVFSLAVTEKWSTGESTLWIDCKAWKQTASIVERYLHKGSQVLVEGSLKLEQWEKDGQKRSKHTVNVQRLTLLGKQTERQEPDRENETSFLGDPSEVPF